MALLALVNHVVKFDFQALLSFDRLQARITSTKSRCHLGESSLLCGFCTHVGIHRIRAHKCVKQKHTTITLANQSCYTGGPTARELANLGTLVHDARTFS